MPLELARARIERRDLRGPLVGTRVRRLDLGVDLIDLGLCTSLLSSSCFSFSAASSLSRSTV